MFRISESDKFVSSNPGVSIKVTSRPESSKDSDVWTVRVMDLNPLFTPSFEPLARLIN